MNTKSTICRNWAKSLKLYKIVQILVMSFDTSIIAENDLEHLVSLCTRSALHHRIRSDNTTILQFLCIIRKLPNNRFDLCKSHPLNNRYSYKSLCRPNVPARAKFHLQLGYTVIPLSKANYPTNYGFIHTMNPTQPTTLLTESPNTFTTVNWWKHPTYALSSWQQRNWPHDLHLNTHKTSRTFGLETSISRQTHFPDLHTTTDLGPRPLKKTRGRNTKYIIF